MGWLVVATLLAGCGDSAERIPAARWYTYRAVHAFSRTRSSSVSSTRYVFGRMVHILQGESLRRRISDANAVAVY